MKNFNRSHLKNRGVGGRLWRELYLHMTTFAFVFYTKFLVIFLKLQMFIMLNRFFSHGQVSPVSSSPTAAWAKHARRPFDVRTS